MTDDADSQNAGAQLTGGGRERVTRRALLGSSAAAAACLAVQPWQLWQQSRAARGTVRPLALVYRGRASSPGIPADTARFLRTCSQSFRVEFCGPNHGDLAVNAATLARASLYVQPGGGNDFTAAWQSVKTYTGPLREFIHKGGRYLGICMGGYLAGSGRDMTCSRVTVTTTHRHGAPSSTPRKTPSSASGGRRRTVARSGRSSTRTARTSGSTATPVRESSPGIPTA